MAFRAMRRPPEGMDLDGEGEGERCKGKRKNQRKRGDKARLDEGSREAQGDEPQE